MIASFRDTSREFEMRSGSPAPVEFHDAGVVELNDVFTTQVVELFGVRQPRDSGL